MSRKSPSRRRGSGPSRKTNIEWVAGIARMSAYVTGEGEPYRPEGFFVLDADGALIQLKLDQPGKVLQQAAEVLTQAMEEPRSGPPHVPDRVRVASEELAEALRAGHPGLEVVVAPTPEFDDLVDVLEEFTNERAADPPTYLGPGVEPDDVAGLFEAAAALYRLAPWKIIGDDERVLSVDIPDLGVEEAVLSVLGAQGESLALLLLSSVDEFTRYLAAAWALERREEPDIPPHRALNYDRGADLPPELRKEVATHGWEVASPEAYPWMMVLEEELRGRAATASDVQTFEAIARALTDLLSDEAALQGLRLAWGGGEAVTRTLRVPTHRGELAVTLTAPHPGLGPERDEDEDVMSKLTRLGEAIFDLSPAERTALFDEVMERFSASPEAEAVEEVGDVWLVMDLAAQYLGETIATLDADDLEEILFEIVPRKVATDSSFARPLIEECRAFYRFLGREFSLPQAEACLRVLGKGAVRRLERALDNPAKFGIGKSLMMAGKAAGFDMSSKEGIDAWMRTLQARSLPPDFPLPFPGDLPFSDDGPPKRTKGDVEKKKAEKKKRRKTARKARKRNR